MQFRRALIIAPHPDDEILGCGGFMSFAKAQGIDVHLAVATTNNSEVRLAELDSVCRYFWVKSSTMFYPNTAFWLDAIPLADLVRHVERCVESVQPDVVFAPTPDSFHQEHRAVSQAVLAALRPSGATGRHAPSVVAFYEAPFDSWTVSGSGFRPNSYLPLTADQVDDKVHGMTLHASQVRPKPSERSEEAIRALAALRGSQVGAEYAEAYEVRRWLW